MVLCHCSLYLIEILHQTTTSILLFFKVYKLYLIEILHQTTTNHGSVWMPPLLYLIEILHQTTTTGTFGFCRRCCILLKFYIKPQQPSKSRTDYCRCILLKFYIKPQRNREKGTHPAVVSYWNSTSNHNVIYVLISYL